MRLTFLSLVAFLFFFQSCGGPENPEFQEMKNVKFRSVLLDEGLGVSLKGDAILHNPNAVGVEIKEIDFDVYAEGDKMTKIRQDVSATMKASSDFTLPLEFDIPLKGIIEKFKKPANLLDMAKKMEIPIEVKGHIKVSVAGASLKIPVDYEEPYQFTPASLIGK